MFLISGRGAVRLAHLTGGQGVVGSNPIAPTHLGAVNINFNGAYGSFLFLDDPTQWPAGVVEKLPQVNQIIPLISPASTFVGDLTGIPLLKLMKSTLQAIRLEFAGGDKLIFNKPSKDLGVQNGETCLWPRRFTSHHQVCG